MLCPRSFVLPTDYKVGATWSSSSEKKRYLHKLIVQSNQTDYFIVRLKVDQRAGRLSLPHFGITKTEKIELKHKTDEQISPVNGLEPWDQFDRQEQSKMENNDNKLAYFMMFVKCSLLPVGQCVMC